MVRCSAAVGVFVARRARRSACGGSGASVQVGRIARPQCFEPRALRDVLTLRHLHATGVDCTTGEETRSPWRRWFHHCTFYGFMLCFASTSVAAIYHTVFGWTRPYGYTSLPVVLGTAGGLGLLVGPAGLLALQPPARSGASATRRRRDWTSRLSRCCS